MAEDDGGLCDQSVTTGKPHREILRIAEEQQTDLIVLGIHGRGAMDRLLFGSTTEPVVRLATCPVLTVRLMPEGVGADTSSTSHHSSDQVPASIAG